MSEPGLCPEHVRDTVDCIECAQPSGYWCIPGWPLRTDPRVGYIHESRLFAAQSAQQPADGTLPDDDAMAHAILTAGSY